METRINSSTVHNVHGSNCPWTEKLYEKFNDFLKLEEGWDGYSGKIVSKETVANATSLLNELYQPEIEIPSITHDSQGSIIFDWFYPDFEIMVRVDVNGEVGGGLINLAYDIGDSRKYDECEGTSAKCLPKIRKWFGKISNKKDEHIKTFPEDITDTTIEMIVRHPDASRGQIQQMVERKHPDRSSVKCVSYYLNQVKIIIGIGKKDTKNAIIYREMIKNPNLLDNDLILRIQKVLPEKFSRTESDIKSKISHMRHTKRRIKSLGLRVEGA